MGMETRKARGAEVVKFNVGDATEFVRSLDRQFAFAFVDHSHCYDDVLSACRELPSLIKQGGFVLFHDYNDPRNASTDEDYGVFQGTEHGLSKDAFQFYGCYGCTGLFRRT